MISHLQNKLGLSRRNLRTSVLEFHLLSTIMMKRKSLCILSEAMFQPNCAILKVATTDVFMYSMRQNICIYQYLYILFKFFRNKFFYRINLLLVSLQVTNLFFINIGQSIYKKLNKDVVLLVFQCSFQLYMIPQTKFYSTTNDFIFDKNQHIYYIEASEPK